jgi:hypothetical protein
MNLLPKERCFISPKLGMFISSFTSGRVILAAETLSKFSLNGETNEPLKDNGKSTAKGFLGSTDDLNFPSREMVEVAKSGSWNSSDGSSIVRTFESQVSNGTNWPLDPALKSNEPTTEASMRAATSMESSIFALTVAPPESSKDHPTQ